jgi:hypothetical protein
MQQLGSMKNGPNSILRGQGGELPPETPQTKKFAPFDRFRCSRSKDSARPMEQLGLMEKGPTSILRQQEGEPRKFLKNTLLVL